MTVTVMLLTVVLSFSLSTLVIWLRLRYGSWGLDVPGVRSLHHRPTPHGGGLGIVAVVVAVSIWFEVSPTILWGAALLAALSAVDDWRHLSSWLRLLVHLAVAASVVFLHLSGAWMLQILLVALIAWCINAYNFMDGADGLAGSMTVIGFGFYAVGFGIADQTKYAYLCASIAASALGFLCFNWHPAKIFMGDIGSIPLGFLAGALGLSGVLSGSWPWWFPLMVFWPFLFDASVTLVRRAWRRERVWQAHREHYYQRMVRMFGSHSAVVRAWTVLMLLGAGLALASNVLFDQVGWCALVVWSAVVAMCAIWVDKRWNKQQKIDETRVIG